MRTLSRAILSLTLLLFGCKKESPVGPTDPTNPPPTSGVVIGPAGGTVSCEGLTVIIPAAAFTKAETLSVAQDQYDNSFGAANVGSAFRLRGLPSSYSGSVRVAVKCTDPTADGTFIAVGTDREDRLSGETFRDYDLLPAILDSGSLKTTISAGIQGAAVRKGSRARMSGEPTSRYLVGLKRIDSLRSSAKHFKIWFRRDLQEVARAVLQHMEEVYSTYKNVGLGWGVDSRLRWPVTMTIQFHSDFKGNPIHMSFDEVNPLYEIKPRMAFVCNEAILNVPLPCEFRKWSACCFGIGSSMALDNYVYQPPNGGSTYSPGSRVWPYYAIMNWASGHFFSTASDSVPPDFPGRTLVPFLGATPPQEETWERHAPGMAGLMKHLADVYGVNRLVDIFFAVPLTPHAIDVLLQKIPEPEYVWWPAFMKRYIAGEIYGITADTLLQEMKSAPGMREFTVAGKGDTLKYFTGEYRDLSARLHRVNLRYADISPTATITFEVGPKSLNMNYVDVMLFGLKDRTLQYWETGKAVTVTKLRDLTNAGYDIVAAVINSANEPPYKGSMPIDLDVRITSAILTHARIKVRTNGVTKWYDGSTSQTALMLYNSSGTFREGTLLNGLFTTRWDTSTSVLRRTGAWTINVDFSTTPSCVTYFKVEDTDVTTETKTYAIESSPLCAIAGGKDQYGRFYYRVEGTAVGTHIGQVYNRLEIPPGYWWEMSSPYYDKDSYIEIIIE